MLSAMVMVMTSPPALDPEMAIKAEPKMMVPACRDVNIRHRNPVKMINTALSSWHHPADL
jgi:hypothetical protein